MCAVPSVGGVSRTSSSWWNFFVVSRPNQVRGWRKSKGRDGESLISAGAHERATVRTRRYCTAGHKRVPDYTTTTTTTTRRRCGEDENMDAATHLYHGHPKALLFSAAVTLRITLALAFPGLPDLLTGRAEISTPVNSFKRCT